ncbi:alkylation response protein AidB-like acyl-CoA dehydrogenase [Lysinibacillus composti]|uniref:Acyl-CoA dehydrogenase/oxidase C-terminal domain-containing protein n=1 Tax=Lysinibacillus composti TaxID=720633 RepID=A0A3N9UL17_9BACI|nr:acyl-CoA dehydrogenase family protein [Lysinibacillus composti]MBM7607458.1 alkylation response protein AidB-like acyl-CoA dehydrogenase [Lysinibacillus composti]RQW75988.1 hypothetical protein EBB45_00055 [Lysinibacillus composti]
MNFDYSDDHKLLQNSIGNLLQKKFPITFSREFLEKGDDVISKELVRTLVEQGLLGFLFEDPSNINEGLVYSILTALEAGRVSLPLPLVETHVTSYILNKFAADSEHNDALSSGKSLYTIGWKNIDVKQSVNNTISGKVAFVPFAKSADFMLIQLEDHLLFVDLKDESVKTKKVKSMDQTYPLYEVEINDYKLQDSNVVTKGDANELSTVMNQIATLLSSAEIIGASSQILDMTVEYTKERKQFGQEIAKFQAIKHKAAEMYVLLESSKAALKYASCVFSTNMTDEYEKVTHLLKSYTSDCCNELMGLSIQLHGGIGFTWESDVHLYYKRARRISVMYGDIYEHREKLFQEILQLTKESAQSEKDRIKS